MGQHVRYRVTSVTGHVYGTDFVPGYDSWEKVDPKTLFWADIRKTTEDKGRMTGHLQNVAKGCDYLILWLDCDKEGENICFEVIHNTESYMNKPQAGCQQIFRAHFSAIGTKDIKAAMNNLGVPNKGASLSVDARQELDLRMGVVFTRFQSLYFHGKYGNLNSKLISYGPCQTPTLGFCVARHDQIQQFKPEKYWVVVPTVYVSERPVKVEWERGRCFDQAIAHMFHMCVAECKVANVEQVKTTQKQKERPGGMNTVNLLKGCSSKLGIGPSDTMHAAEGLYLRGYITYPRTESTAYPASFSLESCVRLFEDHPFWGAYATEVLRSGVHGPKGGKDAGDHPPITPARSAEPSDLGGLEWSVYEYIVQNFLGSVGKNCTYERTSAVFEIGGEKFTYSSDRAVDPGFTKVMTWLAVKDDPPLKLERTVEVGSVELAEKLTSAPGYLTESELIERMEEHGIGTDASIPTHITAIQTRNFVREGPGRTLIPTHLGIVLVHGYYKIDPDLVKPTMRATVEKELGLIADGKVDYGAVVVHTLNLFLAKFAYFVQNIALMDGLFEGQFSTIEDTSGKVMGKCGKCRKFMKYIAMKPCRLYCQTCDETYSLPQNGTIKLYMEKTCPLDEFELVMFSTGPNGLSYPLCPYCYTYPPFEGIGKVMGCNNCLHPTCPQSVNKLGITPCPEAETCKGMLVFDPTSGPCWKMVCNKCNYLLKFAEKAHKVTPLSQLCPECEARTFTIDFHINHNPLQTKETLHTGCLFCDPVLEKTCEETYGRLRKQRGGGRGRGRGRRGRGGKMFKRGPDGKPSMAELLSH